MPPAGVPTHQPWVHIYSAHGRVILVAGQTTRVGFGTPGDLVEVYPEPASETQLGEAVKRLLDASKALPIRLEFNRSRPERKAIGLKSDRAFDDGTRLVSAQVQDDEIVVIPSRNETPRRPRAGYAWATPDRRMPVTASAEIVGSTVREAFADCTFAPPPRRRTRQPSS